MDTHVIHRTQMKDGDNEPKEFIFWFRRFIDCNQRICSTFYNVLLGLGNILIIYLYPNMGLDIVLDFGYHSMWLCYIDYLFI